MNRREFLHCLPGGAAAMLSGRALGQTSRARRPNVLFFTADDMNHDSLGVTGCKIPGITPNLDRLASQGMRFRHAHVSIAVCQPCREVLMTGRYPHRNGGKGFEPIRRDVPTLQESLRAAGYMNGIMAKVAHLAPRDKFCWDVVVEARALRVGRDPAKFYEHARAFFAKAKDAGKPFFLMANSQDPHRPFPGSLQEQQRRRKGRKKPSNFPDASRHYKPEEVGVPGFLPDIPDVRKEVAQYFGAVHRCDETVGQVLRALDESGMADDTLVMFLSDHGMAFPFAKTNCWFNSTRTPWIVRWPGRVKPGTVDAEHMISGVDFMPTILQAAGLPAVGGLDGQSFLPVLEGRRQAGRDVVYTFFFETAAKRKYPMRCVQTRRLGYIFNAWSDGKTVFKNESQSGLSFKAMQRAARTSEEVAARVKLFQYRVPEEFYDFEKDPDALENLIDDPKVKPEIDKLRKALLENMVKTKDPLLPVFRARLGRS